MDIEQAKKVIFDCQECGGRLTPNICVDEEHPLGFIIPSLTCDKCGCTVVNEEDTADLLGV